MAKTLSEIEWEIEQLSLAVDYYEQAILQSFSRKECEEHEITIQELNNQIQDLERIRDEYQR